ncbi:MAG TPA: sensor histidine kinase, partial [Geobacteraceae bacterium]|nr:sensor histidine kinase [Geobacteraceae bacterium]
TAALAKANKMMKKISIELVHAEERERKRIAGELHDRVGQSLLLAKMKLDMLATNAAQGADYQRTQEVATIVEKTIQDIRSLTFTMRPTILETAGFDTALELLCRSIGDDYGLQIEFSSDDLEKPLSSEVRYSLYMAIRELILNIVKHAGVARAHITVGTTGRNLVIHVVDNGAGFDEKAVQKDLATTKGFGLFSVHHRIEGMGGTFAIESAIGRGTHATIWVPMAEQ